MLVQNQTNTSIMKKITLFFNLFLLALLLLRCSSQNENQKVANTQKAEKPQTKEQIIIDEAIAQHGGDNYKKFKIEFDFRKRHYVASRNEGIFQYERIFEDSTGKKIRDVLNNDGFYREVAGKKIQLSKEDTDKYTASVNSVFYFALLPFGLNDEAVVKKYLGEDTIKKELYHKIQVTFKQTSGGEDYQDVYVYWIHQQKKTMDYFAYSYNEKDDSGSRFRVPLNKRKIAGITFADYENYEGTAWGTPVDNLSNLFEQNKLKKFSDIQLENMKEVK